MRVVHISCVAPPEGGGIGMVANQEVLHLRQLGVDAVLVAPVIPAKAGIQKEQKFPMDPRVSSDSPKDDKRVIRLPAWRIGNVARLKGLEKVIQGADVVHLHYPFYFTAGLVARWRRQNKIKRLVITLHHDATDKGWRWLAAELHRIFLQKHVLNSADLLLASTLDYAANSSFAYLVDKKDPRLQELPFGVDTEVFNPVIVIPPMDIGGIQKERQNSDGSLSSAPSLHRDDKMGSFGIPTGAKVVGTVSVMDRAHPFKGIDVFLRAAAKLPSDVHLLLVGDGDRRQAYEQMAEELGLAERTHFVGRLEQKKLIEALQSMDVFAFPSTSRAEAFGLVVLEAMACGVPVVVSDLPGVRSVAEGAGLVVPLKNDQALADALRSLLDDQTSRNNLAKAARAKALRYGWDNHAKILSDHYRRLCASQS